MQFYAHVVSLYYVLYHLFLTICLMRRHVREYAERSSVTDRIALSLQWCCPLGPRPAKKCPKWVHQTKNSPWKMDWLFLGKSKKEAMVGLFSLKIMRLSWKISRKKQSIDKWNTWTHIWIEASPKYLCFHALPDKIYPLIIQHSYTLEV